MLYKNNYTKPEIIINDNAIKIMLSDTFYTKINAELSEAELKVLNCAKQQVKTTASADGLQYHYKGLLPVSACKLAELTDLYATTPYALPR